MHLIWFDVIIVQKGMFMFRLALWCLYFNCEIWLTPNLNPRAKKQLLSASVMALKWCETWSDPMMSSERTHEIHNWATPIKMMKYKLVLQLYKLYNTDESNNGLMDLNFQQNFNGRNNHAQIMNSSNSMIGKNNIANRLNCINNHIDWLNHSFKSFTIKCKKIFLIWQITEWMKVYILLSLQLL